ncbi:MAG: nucleotidyltransferase domain-containing protein [Sphingobacteriales bacterium]|nr:nucleotidyltransferase domain-containing protein [Sphingobacteriales bacterium]
MYLSEDQIKVIKSFFQDKPVKKVYLFGSYARGDADENSDLDVFLVLDDENKKWSYFELAGMWSDFQDKLKMKVDMVHQHSFLKERFLNRINADKTLLFEHA